MFQKSVFSPNCNLTMTAITLHSVLPSSPLFFSPSFFYFLAPFSLSLSPYCLPSSLSEELIDYVSSIHLSLCRLATGALSGVEGGSFTRGGVRWVGGRGVVLGRHVRVVVGVKQKPIVLDSTFILTDTCFPFILYV